MTATADRCPYRVGRSQCIAGDRGHDGGHVWPTLCDSQHIGHHCTETRGHDGLHRARTDSGILTHSWAPRARRIVR